MPDQKLTRKQEAIVAALADPNNKTMTAVAEKAGVSRPSVYKALQKESVVLASKALVASKRDNARSLRKRSMQLVAQDLETVQDPTYRLQVTSVMSKIEAESPEEETHAPQAHDLDDATYLVLAAILHGAKLAAKLGVNAQAAIAAKLEQLQPTEEMRTRIGVRLSTRRLMRAVQASD
jgi:AcrR family transcriptional regulator